MGTISTYQPYTAPDPQNGLFTNPGPTSPNAGTAPAPNYSNYVPQQYAYNGYTPAVGAPLKSNPLASVPSIQVPATPAIPAANPYDQSMSARGYNPYQYATQDTTNALAKQFGATPTMTGGIGGPNGPPPQATLDFGGGYVGNAGLTQQLIDTYGMDRAQKMLADMAAVAHTGPNAMGIGTDPSLQGYNPSQPLAPQTNPTPPQIAAQYQTQSPQTNPNQALAPGSSFTNQPPYQQPNSGAMLPLMFLMSLLGGGQQQQQNPFAGMMPQGNFSPNYGGFFPGNQLSGVSSLLNFIQGLQQQYSPQPAQFPNTSLYFPMFG